VFVWPGVVRSLLVSLCVCLAVLGLSACSARQLLVQGIAAELATQGQAPEEDLQLAREALDASLAVGLLEGVGAGLDEGGAAGVEDRALPLPCAQPLPLVQPHSLPLQLPAPIRAPLDEYAAGGATSALRASLALADGLERARAEVAPLASDPGGEHAEGGQLLALFEGETGLVEAGAERGDQVAPDEESEAGHQAEEGGEGTEGEVVQGGDGFLGCGE
jgi:hypothetical protein